MTADAATPAEVLVGRLNDSLTAPGERECLTCYLQRMLAEFGRNNGLRWTESWQRRNAPRAIALARRLGQSGGYCDCEVLLNVYPQVMPDDESTELPPCDGVMRRGSTRPCRPRQTG